MTDDNQAETPRIIDLGTMTPRQVARLLHCSLAAAEEQRWIARGEWCGDVLTIGDDGIRRPEDHGELWNPGPGEARAHPWPDGTYGHQPRNLIRRWRKAWAADRMAQILAEVQANERESAP